MKFKVNENIAELVEASPVELAWLASKLTWTNYSGNEETVLMRDKKGTWTFANLLPELKKRAGNSVDIEVEDSRHLEPAPIREFDPNIIPGLTLYDHQLQAVKKGIRGVRGILAMPTGSGKTKTALAIVRHLKPRQTILIVPSMYIAEMFYTEATEECGFTKDEIGVWHGNRKELKPFTICVSNSVLSSIKKKDKLCDALRDCDLLLGDEAHHAQSKSWREIWFFSNSKYKLGLTATPYNNVENDPLASKGDAMTLAVLGPTLYTVTSQYLVSKGLIAQTYCLYLNTKGRKPFYPISPAKLHEQSIVNNTDRNILIVNAVREARAFGLSVLVLVQRLEHARILMSMLRDQKVICKFEGTTSLQFDEVTGQIAEFPVTLTGAGSWTERFEDGEWDICIASSVLDEGVDVRAIDFTVLATGNKAFRQMIQRRGRGSRRKKVGDNHAFLVDFVDRAHIYLYHHSMKRRAQYEATGSIILEDERQFWRTVHSTVASRKKTDET